MNLIPKKITAAFILMSFVSVVIFSVFVMIHESGDMVGDCPFSSEGQSLCPQDALSVALHHTSAYYAFINFPLASLLLIAVMALVLVAYLLVHIFSNSLSADPLVYLLLFDPPLTGTNSVKVIRWLSLLENSPSKY